MKRQSFVGIALLFIAASTAQPQVPNNQTQADAEAVQARRYKAADIQKFSKNYLFCLQSSIPLVVESALGHVSYMRIAYPDMCLRELKNKIADLSVHGATPSIRAKAFTALEVFANPSAYTAAIRTRDASGDGLLAEIGTQFLQGAELANH
jgi:hypothetical protein